MDATTILAHLGPYGLAGLLMLAGMKWLKERLAAAETTADRRASEMQARCDQDRRELADKVDKLEERIAEIYEDTVKRSADALADNVQWFKRLCETMDRRSDAGSNGR